MRWLCAAAIGALLLVGCADDADEPLSESPTDTALTTTSTASPSTTASGGPTDAADPADSDTPIERTGIDPSDAYFALDRVLDVDIEIANADWDTLRHQTRTLEDVIAEIVENGLSQPFSKIYSWFSATVTIDGETHADVGIRKKGFVGSQSDAKPSLKLRFDKYVDDQSLGGVFERMTLNNSVQDPSMVNTCMSYLVFAAVGNPAPRCNFATVSVNGTELGLYVHVEEIKAPFLERHFDSAEGNLYEGTVSDFTPTYRGTFEKKTNTDEADWSDIDAVVTALLDESDAGLEALDEIVDLDRYLTHWATEVLIGHWDGYAGNRNNYWFYREPEGRFVFLPWGPDGTFHLDDDPNPFDNISDPPASVLALTAIPNRLYNHPDWRDRYTSRQKQILETVWDADELLAAVDEMAAVVQQHAPAHERRAAATDTNRVRKFILKRAGEILADITPEPPDWPEPDTDASAVGSGTIEASFTTTWGSNLSDDPLNTGTVSRLVLDGAAETSDDIAALAGHSSPDESALLPQVDDHASLALISQDEDGSLSGMTLVLDMNSLTAGARLVIGEDLIAGGVWTLPPGAAEPDSFSAFTEGSLELSAGGTAAGERIAGTFTGAFGWSDSVPSQPSSVPQLDDEVVTESPPLVINEVAAKGDPLDWFELHNTSDKAISLDGVLVADDLKDPAKRVAFAEGTAIGAGSYMRFETDKDAWPGFALGGDEELGIWTTDGTLIDLVDWDEGQSPEGKSFARVPDASGDFETVDNPSPGERNQP